MTGHTFLSPSSAERWSRCAAAPGLESAYPEQTNVYAEEGTRAHEVLADAITEGAPWEHTHPDLIDLVAHVNVCRTGGAVVFSEQHLRIGESMGLPPGTLNGTADVVVVFPGKQLEIIDLKWGQGVFVEAENNPQLWLYLIGAIEMFDEIYGPFEQYFTTVFQPRYHGTEKTMRTQEADLQELDEFKASIVNSAKACLEQSARPTAGEVQCRWCRARPDCAAFTEYTNKTVERFFAEIPGKDDPFQFVRLTEERDRIATQTLANLLEQMPRLEALMAMVKNAAEERARRGRMPGWKLVEGRSNRAWKDPEAAQKKLVRMKVEGKALGLDKIMPRRIITPAKATQIPSLTKKQKEVIAELYYKPPGKPTLVPEADPRPSIVSNVEGKFEPVIE